MADSTVTDFSKMKVVELKKELKSRGLSYTGDKSELVARLQAAVSQEEHTDVTLDSDLDSDGVLEDEDEKSQSELGLEESIANETLSEDIALAESPPKEVSAPKAQRVLKRKTASSEVPNQNAIDKKNAENKESGTKKIILHRATSATTTHSDPEPHKIDEKKETVTSNNKIKISADIDPKTRLEMRAKRFGLPVNISEKDRKEARKIRFGQNSTSTANTTATLSDNIEKLRKRAERFGQNVSKTMTDLENREKLEQRKAKFEKNT